ncbi:MAG: glycosyltransferase [Nibricoccus sp.]
MSLSPAIAAWVDQSLQKEGRLPDGKRTSLTPLPGNPERKDHVTLQRHVVFLEGRPLALLILGVQLAALKERTELFAQAYPTLACPIFAVGSIEGHDVLLAEYFTGVAAQQALAEPSIGEKGVLAALEKLASLFDASLLPSTVDAARAELQELFKRVLAIERWTAFDHGFLTGIVFPFVEEKLLAVPPRRRVTNGDLTLSNLLVDAAGSIKLIDYEQAAFTHFHQEDWLRLTFWHASKAIREFALARVESLPATQLFLHLKQIVFEHDVIRPVKATTDLQHWSSEIRSLLIRQSPDLARSAFLSGAENSETNINRQILTNSVQNHRQATELFEYASQLTGLYNQHAHKIHRMQESFSWRCTAWLRALRRKFWDPSHPPATRPGPRSALTFPFAEEDLTPPASPLIHYQIVSGIDLLNVVQDPVLTGWVFSPDMRGLRSIRARINDRIYVGQYGLERREISEKFLPQAWSGFSVELRIEKSDELLDLEIGDGDDLWLPFFSVSLRHGRPPLATSNQPSMLGNSTRYASWVARYDTLTPGMLADLRLRSKNLPRHPLISLAMPVYNTDERWLRRVIETIQAQVYTNWELCIADDTSTKPHVRSILEQFAAQDSRIKVTFRASNGHISAASNSALELVTGEFTAFVDHDDELPPHALYYFAELICRHPGAELIYSDEDKITEAGARFHPHFKPDWNPDLLKGQNYLCHLMACRTTTLRSIGGFRIGVEGSQDWDLALRLVERLKPEQIHHIPRILYHWRAVEGSTALQLRTKDYTTKAARKTLEDHFRRVGQNATPELIRGQHWHIQYALPTSSPLVTLIIPTRNRRELLATCIESIRAKTKYPNFEFLIADNDSDDPELSAFYDTQKKQGRFTVLPCPGTFNFSAINNRAVKAAAGELIGLLNNDLEALHAEWLDEMVGHALRPEIGVVGAKLYYPDMRIQHAGIITGLGGVAGHAFKNFGRNDAGNGQFRPHVAQNLSAVTAACMVMRKSVFEQAHGFDEDNLKVAFNDVDFCLRVEALGYRNLFTPFAELIHHESASRGAEDCPEKVARFAKEIEFMKKRWGTRLLNDPAYNPNLTLDTEDFACAFPPRHRPHA